MKQFDVCIKREDVFTLIQEKAEAYANHSDEGKYELLALLNKDKALIMPLIDEAAREVYVLARKFAQDFDTDGNHIDFILNMPDASTVSEDSIQNMITSFAARRSLSEWIKLTGNDAGEREHNLADDMLEDIKSMLYHRARPQRKTID